MKRILIALLALALIAGALPAAADTEPVLRWEGFELQPLYYNIRQRQTGDSSLKVYMRVINNTDHEIYLRVDNCWINGVAVNGSGILTCKAGVDTGPESEKYCLFQPLDDGDECIKNPRSLEMKVALYDKGARKDLCHETVTLDMTSLSGEVRVVPTAAPTPVPTPKPALKTLKEGSRGEAVRNLQQRLIELGYLNDKADGAYGGKTATAVRLFCEQNDLPVGNQATPEMQELLFSGKAKYFSEPWIPLEIGAHFKWELIVDSTFFFRIQVTNHSASRTIKGFELSLYQTDLWGKQIGGKNLVYFMDTRTNLAPGKTVYSDNFNLGSFYSTDTVWVGVSKIVFMDGEIREVPRDEIVYYSCLIR